MGLLYILLASVVLLPLSGCGVSEEERQVSDYLNRVYSESKEIGLPDVFQEADIVCLMHPYQNKVSLPNYIDEQEYINSVLQDRSFRVPEVSWYLLTMKNKRLFFYQHKRVVFDMVSPSGTGKVILNWKSKEGYLAKDCIAYEEGILTIFVNDLNERRVGLSSKGN